MVRTPRCFLSPGKSGFTLLELMIATGLLAMFFTFLFRTFTSGSESFNAGTWRVSKQKEAQQFLGRLKELLEKANYADSIGADGDIGTNYATMPIYINNLWRNVSGPCLTTNQAVMYFGIADPFISAQTNIGQAGQRGKWTGVSMLCQNGKLTLRRLGVWNTHNQPFNNAPADTHPPPGNFDDGIPNSNVHIELTDVATLAFAISVATNTYATATGTMINVTIQCARMRNGVVTNAVVTESVRAKLLKNSHAILPLP